MTDKLIGDLLRPEDAIQRLTEGVSSAGGIRDRLESAGIKGVRECAEACPVAVYLIKATGYYTVEVDRSEIEFYGQEMRGEGYMTMRYKEQYPTPDVLSSFVYGFDNRRFPELDKWADDEDEDSPF